MSAVTPQEVVNLVAEAWGVQVKALSEPAYFDGRQNPFKLPGYTARACAVMLLQRHTPLSHNAIAAAIGLSHANAKERQDSLVERFRKYAVRHLDLMWRIEAIEQKIDDIHEARAEESFGFQRVASANLARNLNVQAQAAKSTREIPRSGTSVASE